VARETPVFSGNNQDSSLSGTYFSRQSKTLNSTVMVTSAFLWSRIHRSENIPLWAYFPPNVSNHSVTRADE